MKQIVIQIMELCISALVIFFCMRIFFQDEESNLSALSKEVAETYEFTETSSQNEKYLQEILEKEVPQIKVEKTVFHKGERSQLRELLKVGENESWRPMSEMGVFTLKVLGVMDEDGKYIENAILMSEAEEIKAPIAYLQDTDELCFNKAGYYQLRIRMTGKYGREKEFYMKFLVEV